MFICLLATTTETVPKSDRYKEQKSLRLRFRIGSVCVCVLPVFSAAGLARWLPSLRVLEHVHENGLELAKYHRGNLKVALQPLDTQPEVLRQIGHVGPLPHLREELDQTGRMRGRGQITYTVS